MSGRISEYFNDREGFIEMVHCPINQQFCVVHLKEIDKNARMSRDNWISKDYMQAIGEIKEAFEQSMKITPVECRSCTMIIRSNIIRRMENIYEDLRQITSGIFRAKRHQSSFELAGRVLQEMKERHLSM